MLFFGWRRNIRRSKNGRYCPGIGYKSSLESFGKWWHLVLKQETASGLSKDIKLLPLLLWSKKEQPLMNV